MQALQRCATFCMDAIARSHGIGLMTVFVYSCLNKPQLGRAAIRLKRQAPGCHAGAFWPGLHLGMQMTVDVSWRFALAIPAFSETVRLRRHRQHWPAVLVPWQLAVLQMPFLADDDDGEAVAEVLFEAIWDAAEGGSLEVSERVVEVREAVDPAATARVREAARDKSKAWLASEVARGGVMGAVYAGLPEIDAGAAVPPVLVEEKNTRHYIGPAAFAAWLAVQDMQPSKHIAAWIKACGKGQVASASVAASLNAEDVQDLSTLVQYRLQFAGKPAQHRPQWTAPHVMLVRAWLQQEQGTGRSRGAVGRLAGHMGMTRQGLQSVLDKHVERAQTTAFDGLGRRASRGAA